MGSQYRRRGGLGAFIKAHVKPGESLAAFTGQDSRALEAFAACAELYAVADQMGRFHARAAMAILLLAAQTHVRPTFRLAIAFVLDWSEAEWREAEPSLWGTILERAEDHPPEADTPKPQRCALVLWTAPGKSCALEDGHAGPHKTSEGETW